MTNAILMKLQSKKAIMQTICSCEKPKKSGENREGHNPKNQCYLLFQKLEENYELTLENDLKIILNCYNSDVYRILKERIGDQDTLYLNVYESGNRREKHSIVHLLRNKESLLSLKRIADQKDMNCLKREIEDLGKEQKNQSILDKYRY